MIYFDNAATTKYKPEEVYKAFEYYVREIGVSPGRGSYQLGIEASRMLYKTRKKIAKFFGMNETNVVFTKNSTEAINLFVDGYLQQGDHVIITCYEHNAVLRPIHKLTDDGRITYSVITREDLSLSPKEIYEKYAKENTKLFCTTLASNLTGRIVFLPELTRYMKKKGLTTFVDSSQGAGKIRLSSKDDRIDYIAFTGHKDLNALPGVGGLCCKEKPEWKPLIQGGTGVLGDSYVNPDVFPEGYEAGTLNMPAIWSLNAALDYDLQFFELNKDKENRLMEYLLKELKDLDNVTIYDEKEARVSTVGINVDGCKSSEVVELLDKNEICTRGGIHCAILAHEALGTVESGVVRLSLNYLNAIEEIDTLVSVLKDCR
ncbi:MAG: aminotransferase class V-fold PLP-dependent enzyme [Lachnospiraceae bacterium]|nr:aminotransferase class V-fold PLP-dependent enzyme [Lachnospiraceae bacterium]